MNLIVKAGVAKLPTMLGGGILGIALAGLGFGAVGITLGVGGEVLSAAIGVIAASRYA